MYFWSHYNYLDYKNKDLFSIYREEGIEVICETFIFIYQNLLCKIKNFYEKHFLVLVLIKWEELLKGPRVTM